MLLHLSPELFEVRGGMLDAYSVKGRQFLPGAGTRMLDGGRRRGKFRAARECPVPRAVDPPGDA